MSERAAMSTSGLLVSFGLLQLAEAVHAPLPSVSLPSIRCQAITHTRGARVCVCVSLTLSERLVSGIHLASSLVSLLGTPSIWTASSWDIVDPEVSSGQSGISSS